MNGRQFLRRLFRWTKIFGPALIVLELLGVAAVAVTGNWDLIWEVPFIIVLIVAFTFLRLVLFAFLFFFPVLVAIIVVWAAIVLFRGKRPNQENLESSTGAPPTPSDGSQ